MNRSLRIIYNKYEDNLILADIKGRIHKLDKELNIISSSKVTSYTQPINALTIDKDHIFTKDRSGNIGKWCLKTLKPQSFLDAYMCVDRSELIDGEEPSLSPNRGIAIHNNKLYTNNGFVQMVEIDTNSFNVLSIKKNPSERMIDWMCFECEENHILADVGGNIYSGNIQKNDFNFLLQSDGDITHKVLYDSKHDRFLATQDGGLGDELFVSTGVMSFDLDGSNQEEYKISVEDNEFLEMSPDSSNFYVGGFNGTISIFDNSDKKLSLIRRIGPFSFQAISMAVCSENFLYVLLQTGEVIKMTDKGKELNRIDPSPGCFWIFEKDGQDENIIYAGTDYGVSKLRFNIGDHKIGNLTETDKLNHGFGITKDIKFSSKGNLICISRNGYIISMTKSGSINWFKQITGIPRSISSNKDKTKGLVCSDDGTVMEIAYTDGSILKNKKFDSAVYCVGYDKNENIIVSTNRKQQILVFNNNFDELLGTIQFERRMKRLINDENGCLYIASGSGVEKINTEEFRIEKKLSEVMYSGKENATFKNGFAYVGGYGLQLGTYIIEKEELVDLEEFVPDYNKALTTISLDDHDYLIMGGRSNFINIYLLHEGLPYKQREIYL